MPTVIKETPIVVDATSKVPGHFVIADNWIFGPSISNSDSKDRPTVAADWYKGRLQFLIYEDVYGDPTVTIRFKDGKIAEIEIPRSMQKLIVYENQESAWIKERDKDEEANH